MPRLELTIPVVTHRISHDTAFHHEVRNIGDNVRIGSIDDRIIARSEKAVRAALDPRYNIRGLKLTADAYASIWALPLTGF